jgi:hypothetical protein
VKEICNNKAKAVSGIEEGYTTNDTKKKVCGLRK